MPLDAVYDLAKRITAMYGADGYVLSRAIVPPQDLSPRGAVIRIQVIEGYVSRVEWPREKLARYRDFFSDYTAKIVADRPVNIRTLERYLLLANDLPGLRFTTTLQASKTEQGASVLVVDVTEKRLEVNARFDNRGTVARGPYQFLIAPTVNNLTGMHESLTIVYAGVTEINELQFVAPSYRQVLNSEGLTAFINASYSWGRPGTDILRLLDYRTESTIVEGGFYSPIIRQRERNLTLTALAFLSDTYSRSTDMFLDQTDRLRGVRLRADGDIADSLNGINQFAITVSQGIDGLEAPRTTIRGFPQDHHDQSRKREQLFIINAGKVNFTKIDGFVSRTQPLFDRFSAWIAAYGQYAGSSLLVPEQCGYGGRVFGRAYDPSELLGDHCWMASGELRYDVPSVSMHWVPDAQLYGYVDGGTVYNVAPAVGTPAQVTAASAGGGVRLRWQNYVNVDLSAAKAIEGPRDDWRFFFVTTARY